MTAPLYLMHCQPDLRRLTVWAARHGLHSPQGDLGYALHALLAAAFGDAAPQPFAYQGETGGLLGYSQLSGEELAERAALAAPDVAGALGLDAGPHGAGLSARAYPQQWRGGAVLGFELRVRPVLRQQGRERDVFLVAVEQAQAQAQAQALAGAAGAGQAAAPHPEREAVYLRWLAEQFTVRQAARVLDARMTRFQLSDVLRRTQAGESGGGDRKRRQVGGPDAVFSGHLQIDDPAHFAALVARGVGRHRAFGFGMLLLKPPARSD